jgi:Skp family chaperone for outer membrane proteins
MNQRILHLALEALDARKVAIEKEIAQLQSELKSPAKKSRSEKMKAYWARRRAESTAPARKRRKRTAAEKKAQSQKMKAYWAKRRAEKGKKPNEF